MVSTAQLVRSGRASPYQHFIDRRNDYRTALQVILLVFSPLFACDGAREKGLQSSSARSTLKPREFPLASCLGGRKVQQMLDMTNPRSPLGHCGRGERIPDQNSAREKWRLSAAFESRLEACATSMCTCPVRYPDCLRLLLKPLGSCLLRQCREILPTSWMYDFGERGWFDHLDSITPSIKVPGHL